jgi:FAD/FMN-containing dehydrogenase
MADRQSARVPGHGLQAEGKAFAPGNLAEEQAPWIRVRGHIGRGVCACGAVSDVEWTDAARKRWHRAHKDEERREVIPVEGSEDA